MLQYCGFRVAKVIKIMNFVYVPLTGEFTRVLRSLEVNKQWQISPLPIQRMPLESARIGSFLYKFDLIDKFCAVAKKLDISQLQTFPHSVIAFLRYSAVLF